MKKYITKVTKGIALFYLGFPANYMLGAILLFDIPFSSCVRILLSPLYYFVSAVGILAGYGIWEARRWSWYLLSFATLSAIYLSAVVSNEYGATHHKSMAFLASAALILGMFFRVSKELRVPYFFPNIRWWESNPRYRVQVPVKLIQARPVVVSGLADTKLALTVPATSAEASSSVPGALGEADAASSIAGEMLDLSMGGCFVKTRLELPEQETFDLRFEVFGFPMVCQGQVVWKTQSAVTHPKGVGIKFARLTRTQRKTLRTIIKRLDALTGYYRRYRYWMNPDEFQTGFIALEQSLSEKKRLEPVTGLKDSSSRG